MVSVWGGEATGAIEFVEIVVWPEVSDWVMGASRVVSCTVSIRARPRRVSRSPKRARDEAKSPGPRTRTLVRVAELGRESVWFVTEASAVGGPEANVTGIALGAGATLMAVGGPEVRVAAGALGASVKVGPAGAGWLGVADRVSVLFGAAFIVCGTNTTGA